MPFFLLLLLLLVSLPGVWPRPLGASLYAPSAASAAGLTGMAALLCVSWAAMISWRTRAAAGRNVDRESLLRRYGRARMLHNVGAAVLYVCVLFPCGWGWAVQTTLASSPPTDDPSITMWPGAELLILAPYVLMILLSWAMFYDADRALHAADKNASRPYSRWGYISFRARQSLAFVAAPLAMMVAMRAVSYALPTDRWEWVDQVLGLAMLPVMVLSFPIVLRLVWGLKPLPAGPLRQRLQEAARRLRFRCSNILVWDTHGAVANAMVAGLLPVPRYVLLSDRLIHELTPQEIEAVFGHEVGHVRHHHMLYYLGFLLLSVPLVTCLCALAASAVPAFRGLLEASDNWSSLPVIGVVAAYIFVVFGFLSRRCERQADVFGCRAVSCDRIDCPGHKSDDVLVPRGRGLCPTGIGVFISALEKVATANGINRDRPGLLQSWLHSTFARRVEFLERVRSDPGLEARFQRAVGRIKWAIGLGLVASMAILYLTLRILDIAWSI